MSPAPASVLVYVTEYCGYCVRAKALLASKGATLTTIDVGARPDLRTWLVDTTGQRTVPQIFVNGRSLGGFMEIAALERRGELEPLLAEPPAPESPLPT